MALSVKIRIPGCNLKLNAAGTPFWRMLFKVKGASSCAGKYIDAPSSCAKSQSGKRGTRGAGFHKGAEKSGAQSNVSVVKKERDHESAEKENRSRPGGGWRRHRK